MPHTDEAQSARAQSSWGKLFGETHQWLQLNVDFGCGLQFGDSNSLQV